MIMDLYKFYDYYLNYLIQARKLETINILINQKNYKYLVIYFTRYDLEKSVRMSSLYYHALVEGIEKYNGKKYLVVDH